LTFYLFYATIFIDLISLHQGGTMERIADRIAEAIFISIPGFVIGVAAALLWASHYLCH